MKFILVEIPDGYRVFDGTMQNLVGIIEMKAGRLIATAKEDEESNSIDEVVYEEDNLDRPDLIKLALEAIRNRLINPVVWEIA